MPIQKPETTDWPDFFHLYAYDDSIGDWCVFDDTENPKYDLTDNLSRLLDAGTVFRLGVEIEGNPNWPVWDESSIAWIENRIVWDFDFDGYSVKTRRITQDLTNHPCSEEFIWEIEKC